MFTGIVENLGIIQKIDRLSGGVVLHIESNLAAEHFKKGNSIAVNGVCLTVETYEAPLFTVSLIQETLDRSAFKSAELGQKVNLETSLTLQKPIAGHLVLGHVDFTAKVLSPAPHLELEIPSAFMKYFPEKGSIAVHGVSLTIAKRKEGSILLELIPETLRSTNLGEVGAEDLVNIEIDTLARYLETLTSNR